MESDIISDKTKLFAVAVVVPWRFIPPSNGGQRVCYEFCTSLSKRITTVCFSCDQASSIPDLRSIGIFSSSLFRYFNPAVTLRLSRHLKKNNVQTCIVNQPFFTFSVFLACKIARCQLITYAHNLEFRRSDGFRGPARPLLFLLELVAYNLSNRVFFISRSELMDAVRIFNLKKRKCIYIPHIVENSLVNNIPKKSRESKFTIIFFGNFSYSPNARGIDVLFQHIVPLMSQQLTFPCRLVIFGSNIPNNLPSNPLGRYLCIEILGYIDNPAKEIRQADIMLNPVNSGAGVQTKIIETLSLGTTVISAKTGSRGIDQNLCVNKLFNVEDNDWEAFVNTTRRVREEGLHLFPTPESFFYEYSEKTVMDRVISTITTT